MGFRLKSAETFALTKPEEVRSFASKLKGFGGTESEREDKQKRKENIRSKITGNEMTPFRWAVGEVKETGVKRRVNGQHSSEVFLELTPEEWAQVRFPVTIIWEDYECDTTRDLPTLFEQFDPNWSSRNTEDLIGAHIGIHDDLRDRIDRYVAARVTAGMSWYARKILGLSKESSRQFELVHDNHDTHAFLVWCGSFLQRKKTDEMFHPAVIGAMRHTFSTGNQAGQDFWKHVAAGKAQNEESSAAYKLAIFLEMLNDPQADWPRAINKHFARSRRGPSEAQVFATCLNAYQGETMGKRLGDIFDHAKGKTIKDAAASFQGTTAKAA